MGRKDKKYSLTLHEQVYERLTTMQAFGESKRRDRAGGNQAGKIYSFSTYRAYKKHCLYFTEWLKKEHPDVTTLKKARGHVNEYLAMRAGSGLSAYTVHLEASALNKLFGITASDPDRFIPPRRTRAAIRRSRTDAVRDGHFSETNNHELICFCKATGLRREGLEKITGSSLFTAGEIAREISRLKAVPKDRLTDADRLWLGTCSDTLLFPGQEYFVKVTEKGGRTRFAPVTGPYAEMAVRRFKETAPGEKVWKHVSSNADIHHYRACYARQVYSQYERALDSLPGKSIYYCRGDERGRRLDRDAMLRASKALGHSRIDVVSRNYLYGL